MQHEQQQLQRKSPSITLHDTSSYKNNRINSNNNNSSSKKASYYTKTAYLIIIVWFNPILKSILQQKERMQVEEKLKLLNLRRPMGHLSNKWQHQQQQQPEKKQKGIYILRIFSPFGSLDCMGIPRDI